MHDIDRMIGYVGQTIVTLGVIVDAGLNGLFRD